jgi:hypothetical protein
MPRETFDASWGDDTFDFDTKSERYSPTHKPDPRDPMYETLTGVPCEHSAERLEKELRDEELQRLGYTVVDRHTATTTLPNELRLLPRIVTMSTVQPERVSWLWDRWIARGMLNLLDGDPGFGKSTITIDLAARVTRGDTMPLASMLVKPADVLLIGAEDHLAMTVRPRLDAAGADLARVHVLEAVPREDDPDAPPTLADVATVESIVAAKGVELVVVDPLMAHLPSGTDAYRDSDLRGLLTPWAQMAQRTGAAILVVRHLRKMGGSAMYRGSGSIGIIGAARSAMLVGRDPDDDTACVLAHCKGNLAPRPDSIRYRVVDHNGVGRIDWLGVAEDVTADRLAALPDTSAKDGETDPVDAAVGALKTVLGDGPVPSKQAMADVHAMTNASPRTIERARSKLGVIAERVTGQSARASGWVLSLPSGGLEKTKTLRCDRGGGGLETESSNYNQSNNSLQTATDSDLAGGVEAGGVEILQTAATRSPGGDGAQTVWSDAVLAGARHRVGLHDFDEDE